MNGRSSPSNSDDIPGSLLPETARPHPAGRFSWGRYARPYDPYAACRLLLLAAAVVLIAVLVIPALTETGNEGDDVGPATVTRTVTTGATTTTVTEPPERGRPTVRTINVRGGKPRAGVQKLSYRKGQTVNVVITSDTADEVHVHGYDIYTDVPAGGRARVRFKADAAGIFEIEMHGSGQQIASLRVNPA